METTHTDYPGASTRWTCARKKRIDDEKYAKRLASRMTEQNLGRVPGDRFAGVKVGYYGCTRCGGFHIGNVPA